MNNFLKLKELCIKITDGSHYSPVGVESGIPMLSVKDMKDYGFSYDTVKRISKDEYKKLLNNGCHPEINDILIAKDGSYLKYVFVVSENIEQAVLSSIGILKPNLEKVNPYYIKYYLSSDFVKKEVSKKYVSGSALPRIILKGFENIEIPYVEKSKQDKIVSILKPIDDKIINNLKLQNELETTIKTVYNYWFIQYEFPDKNGKPYKTFKGKMTWNEELKKEIPFGWEVKYIEDYCKIITGKKDVNQSLDKGKYKFYSCSPNYRFSNEKLHDGKAILISGNGSYTGRTIFVNDSFDLYQRTYACINTYEYEFMEYLYYTMLTFFVPIVSGGTHGSAIPYIVYDDIAKQKILINSDVIKKFQKFAEPIQNKIVDLQKENEELENLKKFLLPMLLNGQIEL